MAGGSGTRFWPRSRRRLPKQLLRFAGSRTLLQATVDRLRGIVPASQVLVVTRQDHSAEVRRQLGSLPRANILCEPTSRNTAPCLALAMLEIERRSKDATFAVVPADHMIDHPRAFRSTLLRAFAWADRVQCPVTIGVRPTAPETGYGYIQLGASLGDRAYRARAFVEKPDLARARCFVASRRYLWNSGMFVWRADVVRQLLERHLPTVIVTLGKATQATGRNRSAVLKRAYARLTPVSIDYGIMEKAKDVVVVTGSFGWNDVGSWAALPNVSQNQVRRAPVVAVDASRYVVFSPERLVALVGVDDLIVVDAADALLVCHRNRAQDVRRVVQELERRGLEAYL